MIGGAQADNVITATAMGMQPGGGGGWQLQRLTSNDAVTASLGPQKRTALPPATDAMDAELGAAETMGAFANAGAAGDAADATEAA